MTAGLSPNNKVCFALLDRGCLIPVVKAKKAFAG